jgi:hypothetical protein
VIISITILILIAKIQFLNRSFFFKTSFCDLFFTKFGIKKLRKKENEYFELEKLKYDGKRYIIRLSRLHFFSSFKSENIPGYL